MESWAENLTYEVYDHWRTEHTDWEYGVKVFYGPITNPSDVLILGFQPGGKKSSFPPDQEKFEAGDFSLPEEHEYIATDWPIAIEMRNLFEDNQSLLERCVKTNIIFFRAPDIDRWERLSKQRRESMKGFSFAKIEEIVEKINPSVIVAEGIRTWDELTGVLDFNSKDCLHRGRERLVCTSDGDEPKVVGIMHPSGARISNEDKNRIRSQLLDVLANYSTHRITR